MSKQGKIAQLEELKLRCETDLYLFACTTEPHRLYGDVHRDIYRSWQENIEDGDGFDNICTLLPRDHQKSHMMAVLAAWLITRDPTVTILYVSATLTLAEKQLSDIKNIMTSTIYSILWPKMVNREEGKRERWSNTEICVDHPLRKKEGIRDSTVFAAGLTTNVTGLHCNILMKDDVVVPDNAYTHEGRKKVASASSQLASVLTTGGREFVVGTRYFPTDHYHDLKEMKEDVYDEEGDIVDSKVVYHIIEHEVETGGRFLWPREHRPGDGKPFGFNWKELARKKAKYLDKTQFFAQYYNNPNDMENQRISRDQFLYFDQSKLNDKGGVWYVNNRRLNIYAAIDFAFSQSKKADSTCVVVIGVDHDFNVYVLDIDRFKTNKVETYFQSILAMQSKWGFRKLTAEVTAAQEAVVEYLKDRARKEGLNLKIDGHRPNKYQGAKEERIAAALEPRYQNGQMYHYKGGYCGMLEEELMLENPPHDDIKDTLAIAVSSEIRKPMRTGGDQTDNVIPMSYHSRFGGVSY